MIYVKIVLFIKFQFKIYVIKDMYIIHTLYETQNP